MSSRDPDFYGGESSTDDDSGSPYGPDDVDDTIYEDGTGERISLSGIVSRLRVENDYGYSLWGNPVAFVLSTVAGFMVAMLLGLGEQIISFIISAARPFQDIIEFLVATGIDVADLVGVPILEGFQGLNDWLRQIAVDAGVAAPFVIFGIYLVIGGIAYLAFTRFVPYGRVIGIFRRVV